MAVYKLKNGDWRAQVDFGYKLDGKRDKRTRTEKTQKEARKAEIELLIERDGMGGHCENITFQDFVDKYYLPTKRKALRENTMRGYERDLNLRLLPAFGQIKIGKINRLRIQQMLTACPTYKTATNARETLRTILNEALSMEAIASNPAAGRFVMPQRVKADPQRNGAWITSFAEHRSLIEQTDGDVRTLLVLGLCFGLRKGEILGLDWQDIDYVAREINIRHTYTRGKGGYNLTAPKTFESIRMVPMTDFAYMELKKLKGNVGHIGPVLTSRGKRMTPRSASHKLDKFVNSHDVAHITLFSCRHSFATACVRSGVNVVTLSKWLGHVDITTTLNKYVKPLAVDLKSDANIIDSAYKIAI